MSDNQFAAQYLKDKGLNVNLVINKDDLESVVRGILTECLQKKDDSQNRLLTRDEVCKMLNVSRTTLWHWNKIGYLRNVKIGKSVFYRASDINKV